MIGDGCLRDTIFQPQSPEHKRAIGSKLNTGADFLQCRRLLKHGYLHASLAQCDCGSHSGNAGPNDDNVHFWLSL